MSSGTTENKTFTQAEAKEMCRLYMIKASEAYQAENKKVAERLARFGITPDEFVAYCREREPIKTVGQ